MSVASDLVRAIFGSPKKPERYEPRAPNGLTQAEVWENIRKSREAFRYAATSEEEAVRMMRMMARQNPVGSLYLDPMPFVETCQLHNVPRTIEGYVMGIRCTDGTLHSIEGLPLRIEQETNSRGEAATEPTATQNTGFEQLKKALENVEGVEIIGSFPPDERNRWILRWRDKDDSYVWKSPLPDTDETLRAAHWMRQRIAERYGIVTRHLLGGVWIALTEPLYGATEALWDSALATPEAITEQEATLNAFLFTFQGEKE